MVLIEQEGPPPKQRVLTWHDVDKLIDHLLPQLNGPYDALLMITRGGIVPGGLIGEALDIRHILTASVRFSTDLGSEARLFAWPEFIQFPQPELLEGRKVLIVDDVWRGGRTITTVQARVEAAGGRPELAVLHYKPTQSLFARIKPDYYAAITDEYIIYPWEIDRDIKGLRLRMPE
jgi:hypoxanthine phosphoribosyltransferase